MARAILVFRLNRYKLCTFSCSLHARLTFSQTILLPNSCLATKRAFRVIFKCFSSTNWKEMRSGLNNHFTAGGITFNTQVIFYSGSFRLKASRILLFQCKTPVLNESSSELLILEEKLFWSWNFHITRVTSSLVVG